MNRYRMLHQVSQSPTCINVYHTPTCAQRSPALTVEAPARAASAARTLQGSAVPTMHLSWSRFKHFQKGHLAPSLIPTVGLKILLILGVTG